MEGYNISRPVVQLACTAAALVFSLTPLQAQSLDGPISTSRETIGAWVMECFGETEGAAPCQIYQRVLTQDPAVVAFAIAINQPDDNGGVTLEIALPLGVNLTLPPVLVIGDALRINLAWSRCISTGCLVEGGLNSLIVEALMTADNAAIEVTHSAESVVAIPLSTAGFKDALDRLPSTTKVAP